MNLKYSLGTASAIIEGVMHSVAIAKLNAYNQPRINFLILSSKNKSTKCTNRAGMKKVPASMILAHIKALDLSELVTCRIWKKLHQEILNE